MSKSFSGSTAVVLWLVASIRTSQAAEPLSNATLSPEYVKWRDLIVPTPNEHSYSKIAWRASVLHGIVDAQKQDRPVMIVLMNGHPLGCT